MRKSNEVLDDSGNDGRQVEKEEKVEEWKRRGIQERRLKNQK